MTKLLENKAFAKEVSSTAGPLSMAINMEQWVRSNKKTQHNDKCLILHVGSNCFEFEYSLATEGHYHMI